jgi:hypothetical protein
MVNAVIRHIVAKTDAGETKSMTQESTYFGGARNGNIYATEHSNELEKEYTAFKGALLIAESFSPPTEIWML